MKLKFLAAAAAVLCGANAFASINIIDGDAELFVVVWDESRATYVKDLGLTLNDLTTQDVATNWTFSVTGSANFASFVAEDTRDGGSLTDFQEFGGTRWAVFAIDSVDFVALDGKDRNYLTTTTFNRKVTDSSAALNVAWDSMPVFVSDQKNGGLGQNLAQNNDSFNKLGSDPHFIESDFGGNASAGIFAGNAIGKDAAKLSFCSWDLITDPVPCVTKNSAGLDMQVSFDGSTISVSAVPEPGTYALLLAGLAAVGFMARRRST